MTWLQCLDLSDAWLERGPEGLKPLSALTGLKKLALANLNLGNSDVRFIRELAALEGLDLRLNNLSDGGISTAGLMHLRSLRKLDLRFNWAISDECKQALRTRLPGCEIQFEGEGESA